MSDLDDKYATAGNVAVAQKNITECETTSSVAAAQENSTQVPEKTGRRRLNLDLSDVAYELLEKLAEDTDKTKAEVLRMGLALYGIANEAKQNKQVIAVAENGEVVKEIVIP